jgi:hypothetical protein
MFKPAKPRPANPWWQRWRRRWRAWRGAGELKRHRVELIDVDGRRCKRVRFDSETVAVQVAEALEALAGLDRFPALLEQVGSELRVDYIPGPLARAGRDEPELLALFGELYAAPAARLGLAESGLLPRLAEDLAFLVERGWIKSVLAERLLAGAETRAPAGVWTGYDYIDPVLKNFVLRADGRAIAIDIEALVPGQALGSGLAKARLRWLRSAPGQLFKAVEAAGGPDLAEQYPFIELCFLAAYFRQKIIQHKPGHIRIEALQVWLETNDP